MFLPMSYGRGLMLFKRQNVKDILKSQTRTVFPAKTDHPMHSCTQDLVWLACGTTEHILGGCGNSEHFFCSFIAHCLQNS